MILSQKMRRFIKIYYSKERERRKLMATVEPGSGDIDYLQVISQKVGEFTAEFQLFRTQIYLMMSTAKIKTIGLYNVTTLADLPVPTGPALGFTQDTQTYWVYSGGWKKITTEV